MAGENNKSCQARHLLLRGKKIQGMVQIYHLNIGTGPRIVIIVHTHSLIKNLRTPVNIIPDRRFQLGTY